jgi:YVTN family beta-propeller protein
MLVMVSAVVRAANPTAFVINTSAETLSEIDLNTGIVTNDILTLGSDIYCFPNQIIVRDTLAYVLLSGTAEIQIINLNTESTVGWINFSPGSNPYWMAFLNDQLMYVTLMADNSLAKVDLVTNQVIKMVEVGQSPEGVIIYRNKAYVAITAYDFASYTWGQGKLIIYDTETDEVTNVEILTSVNPQFFDIDKRGIIHCVCTGNYLDINGAVYLVDTQIDEVIDIIELGGSPGQIAITPNNVAWVAAGGWATGGEVYTYNAETHNIWHDASAPLLVDLGAVSVAAFQDSTGFVLTFADIISRHDGNGSPLDFYYLGDGPNHMDFNYVPGDVNGDWLVNIGDAVYLVRHIFHNGPRPLFPAWRGDVNADGNINVGDAVYLTSLIFRQTEKPKIGMSWLR